MSRASKRVAARQAELSKKKKHRSPVRPILGQSVAATAEAVPAAPQVAEDAEQTAPDSPAPAPRARPQLQASTPPDGQPSFRVSSRARPSGGTAADTSRRGLPQLPYLRQDLLTLALVGLVMIVALVVLDLFL